MKRFCRHTALALSLLMLVLSCTACKATLKFKDEGIYNDRTKTYYHLAPTVYEATALVKEYGVMKITDLSECAVYTVPGMDAVEMLATEDFEILCAADAEMPTLMQMAPTILHVCSDTTTVHELKRIEETTDIYSLVHAYTNDESVPYPSTTPMRNLRLRFESTQYPGFYYTLVYLEYSEDIVIDEKNYGRYFLRNVYEDTFVPVSDVIHKAMGYAD